MLIVIKFLPLVRFCASVLEKSADTDVCADVDADADVEVVGDADADCHWFSGQVLCQCVGEEECSATPPTPEPTDSPVSLKNGDVIP